VKDELPTSDASALSLALPDGPLTFVDEGPKGAPALLAVHGIPGSVRDFRYLAPQLSATVRFVRVDLPGFGGSAPARDAVRSLSGRARVLLALADHLGLASFAVLGHSMGGATALSVAAEHSERVRALFLLASVGLRPHRGLGVGPRTFRLMGHGLSVPLLRAWLVREARERYRRRHFPGADSMDAGAFATHFHAIGAADFERLNRAARGRLPPTLIAWAKDDPMVEKEIPAELARALPDARRLVFEDGGHNIQKTRAVELAAVIREMLGAA
jgi:pimeloyl-ACP methyl ester carboxylesterase